MKGHVLIKFLVIILLLCFYPLDAQQPVEKTNSMKVYMHYMPWFETPETIGAWGWHWTMNTRDPSVIGSDGQREIASHYYPLIGPYASRDRDVIEYHLLLMKYAGIDGVLINWYGSAGSNGDLKDLLKSSDSIVSHTENFGMQFAVVLEDRFSASIDDVKENLAYLKDHYFTRDEYIRLGEEQEPLVAIFGPITFQDPAEWEEILPSAGEEIEFLPLWYESGDVGLLADGEYSWVYQDDRDHLSHLTSFYTGRAPGLKTAMGSAYPGFEDFYAEGGAGEGYFTIPHDAGSTLAETLGKAGQYKSRIDMLQLVTFNDFGEGTMFEPTVETGFDYLEQVQAFTGVAYGKAEFELILELFKLRKEYLENPEKQKFLDQISSHLNNLEVEQARLLLSTINPTRILPHWNPSGSGGLSVNIFPNPVTDGNLYFKPDFEAEISRVIISDLSGKVFYRDRPDFVADHHCIEGLDLPQGLFILTIQSKKGSCSAKFSVLRAAPFPL